jgi:hypothetical protein
MIEKKQKVLKLEILSHKKTWSINHESMVYFLQEYNMKKPK